MKKATFFFGILTSLKIVCGYLLPENLKFCVFAGDFEMATLAGEIKKRSVKMMFSVAVNFEQLGDFLTTVRSKTTIITSRKIAASDRLITKRADLHWVTLSDFKDSSFSPKSLSFLPHRKNSCGSLLAIGVVTENGICDSMSSKGGFEKIDCYHYQLMGMLGQRLNFTTETVELIDKRYPYIFPNGTHTGLFNIISDQNVDVSCGSFIVTGKRLEEFDFLWPTFQLETKIFIKRGENHYSWTNFFEPYEKDVWSAIAIYLVLSASTRYFLDRFLYSSEKSKASLSKAFLLSFQIFCYQAPQDAPNRLSIRLVHFFGLLAAMILYPVYSGSVVSFLTIHLPRLPFHDFKGFIADHRYTLLTSEGDFMTYYLYFEIAHDFIKERKNLLVGLENLPPNIKEGMKRVCNKETFAYADSKENLAVVINELECQVVDVPEPILVLHFGMIMEENMPCRDQLASELRYLHASGITKRMRLEMVPPLAFAKLHVVKRGAGSISIQEIYPCLVLHALGLLAVTLIFLIEICFAKRYRQSQERKFRHRNLAGIKRRRLRYRSFIVIQCEAPLGMYTFMM